MINTAQINKGQPELCNNKYIKEEFEDSDQTVQQDNYKLFQLQYQQQLELNKQFSQQQLQQLQQQQMYQQLPQQQQQIQYIQPQYCLPQPMEYHQQVFDAQTYNMMLQQRQQQIELLQQNQGIYNENSLIVQPQYYAGGPLIEQQKFNILQAQKQEYSDDDKQVLIQQYPKDDIKVKEESKQQIIQSILKGCSSNNSILLKKKINKENQKNNAQKYYKKPRDKVDTQIWRQNLKPQTGHIPTNFMNILVPYLLKIWKNKIPCRLGKKEKKENECECEICQEFTIIRNLKKSRKNVGLQAFKKLWENQRIRAVSLDYINRYCLIDILDKSGYRNPLTKISLLLCLKIFHTNVKKPQNFYKFLD